jgi:hypothetical protein
VSGQLQAPAVLYLGKELRNQLHRRLGAAQNQSEWDSNSDPSVIQPVGSRYTDSGPDSSHLRSYVVIIIIIIIII